MIPAIEDLDPDRFEAVSIFDPELKSNPARHFVDWATRPPFYVALDGVPNGVITRHADVKRAFIDYELFSVVTRPAPGMAQLDYFDGLPNVGDQDPPAHTKLRRLMQPAFMPRRMAAIEAGVATLVATSIADLTARGEFDAMADFAHPLSSQVLLGLFLDLDRQDWPIFTRIAEALSLVATVPPGAPKPAEYVAAFAAGRDYCERLIALRRQEPADDLFGAIIQAYDEGGELTTEEMFGTMLVLLIAGLGALADFLGLAVIRLCRHGDQFALLRRDPGLAAGAVEEVLRIDAVGNFRHRFVTRDCIFEGLPLYEGMMVHISMAAPNYDPTLFPDPARFDIRRPNARAHLTFGHNVHNCIGQPIVRLVGRIALAALAQAFPRLRFAEPDFQPRYIGVPTERQPERVPVRVD